MTTTPAVIHAVNALSDGFAARDVDRCLACYVPDDNIIYIGSEDGETAHGRQAVHRLLTELFLRPEAYSWDLTSAVVHPAGNLIHLTAEATGHVTTDGGSREDFPYRISGLLQPSGKGWQWRICVGAEPAVPQPTAG
jgi:ketosteroid isomerase-like protein